HAMPSQAPRIVVEWTPSSDPPAPSGYASGLLGYASSFSLSAQPECSGGLNLPDPSASILHSEILPAGAWYFHLCAIDAAGNRSSTAVLGPLEILPDLTPPQVVRIDSVARSADGLVTPGEELDGAVTQLLVDFSEQVVNAGNIESYLLVSPGSDGIFQTAACALEGDDESTAPASVSYDNVTQRAVLRVSSLPAGAYRLLTCSAIRDLRDNELADGFDQPIDFTALGNHLANANFDENLSGWTVSDSSAFWLAEDSDGAATSGAARSVVKTQSESLAQCLEVESIPGSIDVLVWRARVRINERSPTPVHVTLSMVFYEQEACAEGELDQASSAGVEGDTGGTWSELELKASIPPDARSVQVRFDAVPEDLTADADIDLDRCSLRRDLPLFADDLETGDLSSWSEIVP
ncbi:hypothetical protein AC249_AIPGENE2423, partial [Exaiptasia diaphana]